MAARAQCSRCRKARATVRCGGCLQEFCSKHSADHRLELSRQLDDIEVGRDTFHQKLMEQPTNSRMHPLFQQIDNWECESIKNIRQTAKEARLQLSQSIAENTERLRRSLQILTQELRNSREQEDFVETELRQWNNELAQLTQQLQQPVNINVRQDTVPLVYKINVNLVVDSDWRNDYHHAAADFSIYRDNNKRENINTNGRRNYGLQQTNLKSIRLLLLDSVDRN